MAHSQDTAQVQAPAVDPNSVTIANGAQIVGARRQSLAADIQGAEQAAGTLFGPAFRLWLYGVIIATMPVLSIYGFVNGQQIEVWTNLAQAVLATTGLVTAVANISKS